VRAPFSGRLGIREVDLGEYLDPGTRVTVLEALGGVFVDFSLPQAELGRIKVGLPVRMALGGDAGAIIQGVVSAVDPAVDGATRSLKLRASVPNRDDRLRPGMFVSVSVILPSTRRVVTLPLTAIVYASYGDSVFVIEPKKPGSPGSDRSPGGKPIKVARQQFVRLGESRGDFVVIAQGVEAGQEVVSAGAFKLRNGSLIVIDNSVQPDVRLNPRPENR
jgi:membrane fusion protein (multidrug efflux system)